MLIHLYTCYRRFYIHFFRLLFRLPHILPHNPDPRPPSQYPLPTMLSFPPAPPSPRVVLYHQTHYDGSRYVPLSPLLDTPTFITHLILAAIHLNDTPGDITLNNHPPSDPRFDRLWDEAAMMRVMGTKVMGMLGGAAQGSYQRLSGSQEDFEKYYIPLRDMIRKYRLDGLDLDVEEEISLETIIRLIDRLHADFGPRFIITLAPVAPALIDLRANLSGFSYPQLEQARGHLISFYNAQFYCNWGDLATPMLYDHIILAGWKPERVVAGTVTSHENGAGHVPVDLLADVLLQLRERYPTFGGVMGWEYFNSLPGGRDSPDVWVGLMGEVLGTGDLREAAMVEASERDLEWDAAED